MLIQFIMIIFARPGVLKGASGFLELHQVCIICPAGPSFHKNTVPPHSNGGQEHWSLANGEKRTDLAAE